MYINKKIFIILFFSLFLCGFVVRLYRLDNPIADWHAWRQADTSSVSRNLIQQNFNPLVPTYDDISNIQSGKDNPNGYRMVEFPLYNIAQVLLYRLLPLLTLEQAGRLVSILSSLVTALLLFLLVSRYAKKEIALLTSFFYLFIPYNIYYNRTILPDSMMVTAIITGTYFFDKFIYYKKRNLRFFILLVASIVFTASAFLLKPYALFFTIPILYMAYKTYGMTILKKWELYIFTIFSLLPFIGWRIWILQFPEGIPANLWLLNGNGIRFRPAFFRWIIYERITKLILGYIGIILPFLGLNALPYIENIGFYFSFAASTILYITVFATGNVQHDYYQILIMPNIALFCALGAYFLLQIKYKYVGFGIFIILTLGTFYFGWMQIKDYFNINNEAVVRAGYQADKLLPKQAKVIAPYGGDTTLLYYINRKGWPAFQASTEELISKGATHAVILYPSRKDRINWGKNHTIIKDTSDFIIIKLR